MTAINDLRPRSSAGRISAIATLPVFFKLGGRRVLLAGGTPPAVWKAELLAAAGAAVLVLAAEPCDEMLALAATLPDRVRVERRAWARADLDGVALAVGAFLNEEDGTAFRDAARAAGVPVNVVDVPPLCDFQFGTIVERSPLVIGVSTDGAAPVLGQAIRTRIEALLPRAMGAWAEAAKAWRLPLRDLKLDFAARRRFWERFADMALEGADRQPREEDRRACLAAAQKAEHARRGRIMLVGAGPGEPDLMTLQAVKALQTADLIIYEPGIAPPILGLGRREAMRRGADDEAIALAMDTAEDGATVAWIGPGDPEACAEWVPRREALSRAGLAPVMVRGFGCKICSRGCAAQ